MSGDPEQEYFADGVVEEIITALSRFGQLFVIARNSSFTYTIHSALHIEGTAHGVNDRKKFDENPVASSFHDAAAMERNGGIDQLATKVSQALERALLIEPSQSRITRHIGGEDRGKLSRCAHRSNARRLRPSLAYQ
jgi:hypothetical protein